LALDKFIPEIWSSRMMYWLTQQLVYAQPGVVNTDWEGEIKQMGDTVRINDIGDVTVFDYSRNAPMSDPQILTDSETLLTVTQSKAFNFAVDDLDKAQMKTSIMDRAMQKSAYALRGLADSFVAAKYVDVPTGNIHPGATDGSPLTTLGTEGVAYELLVDLSTILNENDIPEEGRWVVVPPFFHGAMQKDKRFVLNALPSSEQVRVNGRVARAAGFDILISNRVPNTAGAKYKILAGHQMGISYAEQVNKVEAYRPEKLFADAVKGLHLYGAKTVYPKALALATINRP
jgi:hypothetical protein